LKTIKVAPTLMAICILVLSMAHANKDVVNPTKTHYQISTTPVVAPVLDHTSSVWQTIAGLQTKRLCLTDRYYRISAAWPTPNPSHHQLLERDKETLKRSYDLVAALPKPSEAFLIRQSGGKRNFAIAQPFFGSAQSGIFMPSHGHSRTERLRPKNAERYHYKAPQYGQRKTNHIQQMGDWLYGQLA
jgi:hypothetical protein